MSSEQQNIQPKTTIGSILKKYRGQVMLLVGLAIGSNILSLFFPKLIANAIDAYNVGTLNLTIVSYQFLGLTVGILIFMLLQSLMQTLVSARSAKDLRKDLIEKISHESYAYTQEKTPSLLLTNLTSDIDAVKNFVATVLPALISSGIALIGASALILYTDWRLGLWVLSIIPAMGIALFIAFSRMGGLFKRIQEIIDASNGVINNSIIGAGLIRVLHSGTVENSKFNKVNTESKEVGMKILSLFSSLIPVIMLAANVASLAILYVGGKYVINGTMSFGTFAAFNSYVSILMFPIFIIGFTSSAIGQAKASITRIQGILDVPTKKPDGTFKGEISGNIEVKDVSLSFGNKQVLKDVSFEIKAKSKVAILGPTGGGKTQLLHILSGLVGSTKGDVLYDGRPISEYNPNEFYKRIGLVFQDSVLFNLSLRENIAFGSETDQKTLEKAIEVAGLKDFVATLPKGMDTLVSERGTSLSGGQKQRIMLARALTQNPKVLFLDDFTARVDAVTEKQILEKIHREFPDVTLISVTQKIASIETYDAVIVLVEGEVVAVGPHSTLVHTSPEYVQIYESQKSTTKYELQS